MSHDSSDSPDYRRGYQQGYADGLREGRRLAKLAADRRSNQQSRRIKKGLQVAKARGAELGKHGKDMASQSQADAEAQRATIQEIQAQGYTSIRAIRDELNRLQVPSRSGKEWNHMSVSRLLKRLQET